jgi:hypothetical protein
VESAKQLYNDFDSAVSDLQPIYGAPKEILQVALRRQAPNPIIRDAGFGPIPPVLRRSKHPSYLAERFSGDAKAGYGLFLLGCFSGQSGNLVQPRAG